ncbi:YgiT-type zinc finger protein [Peptococcaceae bacterium 1198_IL3148]
MVNDRCEVCGSHNVKLGTISLDYLGKEIKKVPAIICSDCGEEMVTSDVMDKVDKLVAEGKEVYQDGPVINIRYGGCVNEA